MKTFKGNMHEYIFQSGDVCSNILHNSQNITAPFLLALSQHVIDRIIITGAGTSNYSAQSVRHCVEEYTGIETWTIIPSLFTDRQYLITANTLMIGISATGSSVNTIEALRFAKKNNAVTIAVTNETVSNFAKENDYVLPLNYGVEDVSPKSKSYVAEMLTLTLCAIEYAYHVGKLSKSEYEDRILRLHKTISGMNQICNQADKWYLIHEKEFASCKRMLVVGYSNNFGNIQEGSLKILECSRIQSSPYELEEFMHGIYHSINDDTYLLYLANNQRHFNRCMQLRNYLSEYTQHQFVICKNGYFDERSLNANFTEDTEFYYLEYILPIYILAYKMAMTKGINPNIPSDPLFHQKMKSKIY